MADNVTANAGSGGATFATDDVGGVHYPKTKIAFGANDSATDVSSSAGLPVAQQGSWSVTIGDGSGPITVDGTVAATQSGTWTEANSAAIAASMVLCAASLSVADDWDESDRCKVNLIVGQAGVAAGAGAVDATTQRVTHASDDPVTTALQIMDDWDESDRAKVNLIASQAGITGGAGGVAANTPRMTLASDDPAVASLSVIDDWDESDRCKVNPIAGQVGVAGGSGGVSALTQRTTIATDDVVSTALAIMDDWDESDRAKVNLVVGQAGITAGAGSVAANTPRVTHASDDPAVTALQLMDDPVFTDDAAFTPGTSKVYAVGLQADETATDSVDEGDIGCPRMTLDRKQLVALGPHTAGGLSISSTISAGSTNATVVKASAGQLYGWVFSSVNASPRYLKIYNKATTPDENDTPVLRITIPGNAAGVTGHNEFTQGIAFSAGISFRLTTGVADNNTGAVSADEHVINLLYK